MKKLFVILLAVGALSSAFVSKDQQTAKSSVKMVQDGIQFDKMSLEDAMALAKKSGKIIFIDAYTDWCGPCKKMASSTFTDENVAKVFNSKFVNIKIEMEKSADGPTVAKMYGVRAYPTLLFIDSDGKLKKSVIGFQTAEQLLAIGKSI